MLKNLLKNEKQRKIVIASSGLILASVIAYPFLTEKIIISSGDVEKYLSSKDYYNEILDYTNYKMGNINVTFMERFNSDEIELENIYESKDSNMEKLRKVINYINEYKYNDFQNDPRLLKEYGGNCQAKSLLAEEYFKSLNWESELVTTTDHMYNRVKVDDTWYKLDLTYNVLEKEK